MFNNRLVPSPFAEYNKESFAYLLAVRRTFLDTPVSAASYEQLSEVAVDYRFNKPRISLQRIDSPDRKK